MALTVFQRLMKRHHLSADSIGRIDVGSESNPDRAKSIRSHLLQLLTESSSQPYISAAGSDCVQACYGGTAAVLNSLAWLESSQWDQRLAVVVTADVAVYAPGPARATGGCGAVALLLGRAGSPILTFPTDYRRLGHASEHIYDFYKPSPHSEHPIVNGPLSINSYINAALSAFADRRTKMARDGSLVDDFDFVLFHSPYAKIVQKTAFRLASASCCIDDAKHPASLEDEQKAIATQFFRDRVNSGLQLSRQLGNLYCGSLYCNLMSCILECLSKGDFASMRLGLFSYGSGSMATLFELELHGDRLRSAPWLVDWVSELKSSIQNRCRCSPQEFEEALQERSALFGQIPWKPADRHLVHVLPDTFYLAHVDDQYRRVYRRA